MRKNSFTTCSNRASFNSIIKGDIPRTSIDIQTLNAFFKSGILTQQPRAPLEGVSGHFFNMYCILLKQCGGEGIFALPGQTSQQSHDPFTSDSVSKQKWRFLFFRFRDIYVFVLGK